MGTFVSLSTAFAFCKGRGLRWILNNVCKTPLHHEHERLSQLCGQAVQANVTSVTLAGVPRTGKQLNSVVRCSRPTTRGMWLQAVCF